MNSKFIARAIRTYRMTNNIQQCTMARLLNISPSELSKLELGKHQPKGNTVMAMITVLFPDMKNKFLYLEAADELIRS